MSRTEIIIVSLFLFTNCSSPTRGVEVFQDADRSDEADAENSIEPSLECPAPSPEGRLDLQFDIPIWDVQPVEPCGYIAVGSSLNGRTTVYFVESSGATTEWLTLDFNAIGVSLDPEGKLLVFYGYQSNIEGERLYTGAVAATDLDGQILWEYSDESFVRILTVSVGHFGSERIALFGPSAGHGAAVGPNTEVVVELDFLGNFVSQLLIPPAFGMFDGYTNHSPLRTYSAIQMGEETLFIFAVSEARGSGISGQQLGPDRVDLFAGYDGSEWTWFRWYDPDFPSGAFYSKCSLNTDNGLILTVGTLSEVLERTTQQRVFLYEINFSGESFREGHFRDIGPEDLNSSARDMIRFDDGTVHIAGYAWELGGDSTERNPFLLSVDEFGEVENLLRFSMSGYARDIERSWAGGVILSGVLNENGFISLVPVGE